MKRIALILSVFMVFSASASAQDSTRIEPDLDALRAGGVPASIRSNTAKRNPETGRSQVALVRAYTSGLVVDADQSFVFFIAEDGDTAWIPPHSVDLLESAESLIARLRTDGRDITALVDLNDRCFPDASALDDASVLADWEATLRARGVPVTLGLLSFRTDAAGGILLSVGVKNISERVISAVRLQMIGFSERGDVVRDAESGLATHEAILRGTIRSGDSAMYNYSDRPIWRNRSTSCIEVRRIDVEFEDGGMKAVDFELKDARPSADAYHVMGECSRGGSN